MNIIKLIKHIKKVGWKEFRKDFNEKQEEVMMDQKTILRIQSQGLTGNILFSLVTVVLMAYNGFWTFSGVFLFNSLFVYGQLKAITEQIKTIKTMEDLQKQLLESESQTQTQTTTEKVALENIKG